MIDLIDRQIYLNEASKFHPVGTVGETSDGRRFRYALEGGNAVVASALCQSRVSDADWDTVAIATTTKAADVKVVVTSEGDDTWAKDELENGYLTCETDPGNTGPNFWRIGGNDPCATTGRNFGIYLAEGATVGQVLTASTDTVNFASSPWSKFIIHPGTATGIAVGVTMLAITASRYCWLQTRGVCGVLYDNSGSDVTVGEMLIHDATSSGRVENVTTSAHLSVIGRTITVQGQTDGDVIPVFLTIE